MAEKLPSEEKYAAQPSSPGNRKDADTWHGKGNAFRDKKKYDDAIKCYDKAIELDPNFADPWYGKGKVFFTQKKVDDAIKCYDKAIELDPKPGWIWYG